MKPILSALLFLFAGCTKEVTRDTWEPKVDHTPHLQKNAITGEYRVIQVRGYYGFRDVLIKGDSATCARFIDSLKTAQEKKEEEQRRQDLIWRSWFNVIMDSAAAQTDRELKPQIDSLTKVSPEPFPQR